MHLCMDVYSIIININTFLWVLTSWIYSLSPCTKYGLFVLLFKKKSAIINKQELCTFKAILCHVYVF